MEFMEKNKRNPSRYDANERGLHCNWIKHNKKLLNSGEMKQERVVLFNACLSMMEVNKKVNQYR